MALDYSKLRGLTARRLMVALERDGFAQIRSKGSHPRYRHPDGRKVTISFHKLSGTFKLETLRSMIEIQANWTEEDLMRLKLLK